MPDTKITDIVLYQFRDKNVSRPAIVVRVNDNQTVNLQVFTDFTNDDCNPVEWKTDVPYSATRGSHTYRLKTDDVSAPQPAPAPDTTETPADSTVTPPTDTDVEPTD